MPDPLIPSPDQKVWFIRIIACFLLIGAIGVIDYLTGYELAFSPFYLLPIFIIAWLAGYQLGTLAAILSTLAWLLADVLSGHTYSNPAYLYVNTALRLLNFLLVTFLAARLKKGLDLQNQLARQDVITGLANARAFLESLDKELLRAARYNKCITVIYLDMDNFKHVNDQYGHLAGDQVLRDTGKVLSDGLRVTDFVARMGGDEFAMLLPETGQEEARTIGRRIHSLLCDEMARQKLPVTYSMGAVTVELAAGITSESLLRQADDLMYHVKESGKNDVSFALYAA